MQQKKSRGVRRDRVQYIGEEERGDKGEYRYVHKNVDRRWTRERLGRDGGTGFGDRSTAFGSYSQKSEGKLHRNNK